MKDTKTCTTIKFTTFAFLRLRCNYEELIFLMGCLVWGLELETHCCLVTA